MFIPRDTTGITSYFREAYLSGMLYQFAYDFVDKPRETERLQDLEDLQKF